MMIKWLSPRRKPSLKMSLLKEDVLGIDEVVITATKTKENRKDAPVLVSVTTHRELANVKAHTLMEGLVFQPGLRTEVNCQNCGTSQVRINGLGRGLFANSHR